MTALVEDDTEDLNTLTFGLDDCSEVLGCHTLYHILGVDDRSEDPDFLGSNGCSGLNGDQRSILDVSVLWEPIQSQDPVFCFDEVRHLAERLVVVDDSAYPHGVVSKQTLETPDSVGRLEKV